MDREKLTSELRHIEEHLAARELKALVEETERRIADLPTAAPRFFPEIRRDAVPVAKRRAVAEALDWIDGQHPIPGGKPAVKWFGQPDRGDEGDVWSGIRLTGAAVGVYEGGSKTIWLDRSLEGPDLVLTLLHEANHAMGVTSELACEAFSQRMWRIFQRATSLKGGRIHA